GHVVRHIVGVVEIPYGFQVGIFQVLYSANGGLLPVVVGRKQRCQHGFIHLAAVIVQATVLFFVYGFQLGMEKAEHGLAEALCLYGQVFIDGVGRNVLLVDGFFYPGMGIGTLGAHAGHHFIILVGNGVFGGQAGHAVYPAVNGFTGICAGSMVIG